MHFIFLLFCFTVRAGIYIGLRLTSSEKMFEWTFIKPVVFYLTYSTDIVIVCGLMYFISKSAPLKD
jgi:hypothetical protein